MATRASSGMKGNTEFPPKQGVKTQIQEQAKRDSPWPPRTWAKAGDEPVKRRQP